MCVALTRSNRPGHRVVVLCVTLAVLASLPLAGAKGRKKPKVDASTDPALLQVVDCLLPGTVRKLGRRATYLTPRRPARITALDCEIRGGEYVAYDRANYATALKVWLAQAESGDPEAQYYVGEIFEKGLGIGPDYETAALWYRKAAESGLARAQVSLGYLFEQGLGVEPDPLQALDWYRRAAGAGSEGLLLDAGPGDDGTERLRSDNERLRAETAKLEQRLQGQREDLERARTERAELERDLARIESERARLREADDDARAGRQAEIDRLGTDLEARRRELEEVSGRNSELEDELRSREESLEQMQRRVRELESAREGEERKEDAAASRAGTTGSVKELPAGSVAPPAIELIDPPLVNTRGGQVVRADAGDRELIGRVSAPAGLFSFTVNGRRIDVEPNGLFHASVAVEATGTPVTLAAVDHQGKRTTVELELQTSPKAGTSPERPEPQSLASQVEFGTYHALIIGNNEYKNLTDLKTAVGDANALAELLRTRYGFRVQTLLDATRHDVLTTLYEFASELSENDNLLIYYAGHGQLNPAIGRGYWLPVDAERDNPANWISTADITDYLGFIAAKQILVVADSCYSGALTRSSLSRLEQASTAEARLSWLRQMAQKRSRIALTSGGLQPVLDAGGGGHSVFSRALLDVLSGNGDVLEGRRLFLEVSARVVHAAEKMRSLQEPEYAPIRFAGHETGDFFFVPKRATPAG